MNLRHLKNLFLLPRNHGLNMITKGLSTTKTCSRAEVIDGRKMAEEVLSEVKLELTEWVSKGNSIPQLTAILVGDDPASKTYVKHKMRAAHVTGINSKTISFHESVEEAVLCSEISKLNSDPSINGILVQLPLPRHINERRICNMVAPEKDVDGFHVVNVGRFCVNEDSLVPATPAGVIELIRRSGIETFGKHAVVCGRSKNVGMPIAMMLHSSENATTTICHRHTPADQLEHLAKQADILIVATGRPNLIRADMVKEGAAVIDVGVNKIYDPNSGKSRLVGDVDFDEVCRKAGKITPVPGGVGPMTVAMLMKNTLKVAKQKVVYEHCWDAHERYFTRNFNYSNGKNVLDCESVNIKNKVI
ncbi:hypothetical protein HELRODRAFT_109971 [Helobdella robusta]|uniref:methenyltetrahydrofolate cyclohydrolase n=1 Tax=Helobdella robusta TaxID=6412 RepID=T1EEX9_HELRO|nr:hypothetical protein HELRODRAFT_109971 [Helobdella robusta]ESO08977.1 hypothetical protein HELRODRAFT_109971 [Helobdella robusta]